MAMNKSNSNAQGTSKNVSQSGTASTGSTNIGNNLSNDEDVQEARQYVKGVGNQGSTSSSSNASKASSSSNTSSASSASKMPGNADATISNSTNNLSDDPTVQEAKKYINQMNKNW